MNRLVLVSALVVMVVVGGLGGLLAFRSAARGGLTDVSERPELAPVLVELASLDACEVEYGSPFIRGMNADERKWHRVLVHDCSAFSDAVWLPVPEVVHTYVRLRRSSAKATWELLVDPGAVTPAQVSAALDTFKPVLLSQYPAAIERERAAMNAARRAHEERSDEARSQRTKNQQSWGQ